MRGVQGAQLSAQMVLELDSLDEHDVVVIVVAGSPELLDPALLRAGAWCGVAEVLC